MGGDRKSKAASPELISDPQERAKREVDNGLRQFDAVVHTIDRFIAEGRPFRLRPSTILGLHRIALDGISSFAGNFRPSTVTIGGSRHQPPGAHLVPELVEELCDYVNEHWEKATPFHLAAYVMWRINWIPPFDDGNGRTSRAVSYPVLCMRLRSRLPGLRTVPDLISENKAPYYAALESADTAFANGAVDVSELEKLLEELLAAQFLSIIEAAKGSRAAYPDP